MDGLATRIIEVIANLAGWRLYAVSFLLAFAESALFADLIVPGEVGLVVVGAAGRKADSAPVALVAVAAVGALAGDLTSYALGRFVGHRLLERWSFLRRHLGPKVESAEEYFADHGMRAVVIARFIGALRAVVPFVAGVGRMPILRFAAVDAVAAVVWASIVVTLGWHFGRPIAEFVDTYQRVLLGLVAAGLVGWWLWRRRLKARDAAAERLEEGDEREDGDEAEERAGEDEVDGRPAR
jgi:membrane-associated protein